MRYIVFTKNNYLSGKPDWLKPVDIKKAAVTEDFETALRLYDIEMEKDTVTKVVFLVADFMCWKTKEYKDKNPFFVSYVEKDKGYFPFFVIKCSDDSYFNYEETYDMCNIQVLLLQRGIQQAFFDPVMAFRKYEYYKSYRIDAELALRYKEPCGVIITTSTVCKVRDEFDEIYMHHKNNAMVKLGFEKIPGKKQFGPFWIKDKDVG